MDDGNSDSDTAATPLLTSVGRSASTWPMVADPTVTARVVEYFAARIRNPGTREAYLRAVGRFLAWCSDQGLASIHHVRPPHVAAYIELLGHSRAAPTVKRALAAIRSLFDDLASGGHIPFNPADPVRGPRHAVTRGTTPVLTADEARQLLLSIPTERLIDLRDRALIGTMIYTFARVSAAVAMRGTDYFQQGRRWFVRLHEKNGRLHQVPAHSKLQELMEVYLHACGVEDPPDFPLFPSFNPIRTPTLRAMSRHDAIRMVKRRAIAAGLSATTCCHSFRATGITAYLANGGLLETAQALAGHASAKTTSLYDRRADTVGAGEIERINI